MVLKENQYQPLTPNARIEGSLLEWDAVENIDSYIIIKDGKDWKTLPSTTLTHHLDSDGEYAVVVKGTNGWRSYMSEPLSYYQEVKTYTVNRKISRRENIIITIPIEVVTSGLHAIDWRYANGNGPINTENKCATRVLTVDGLVAGVSVFPHRGTDEWNNWGWSNATIINLNKGKHIVTLEFCDTVENMNIHVNEALLDQMRVTKL